MEAKREGFVKYINLRIITSKKGDLINMNRNGQIAICDETGRERERYPVV